MVETVTRERRSVTFYNCSDSKRGHYLHNIIMRKPAYPILASTGAYPKGFYEKFVRDPRKFISVTVDWSSIRFLMGKFSLLTQQKKRFC